MTIAEIINSILFLNTYKYLIKIKFFRCDSPNSYALIILMKRRWTHKKIRERGLTLSGSSFPYTAADGLESSHRGLLEPTVNRPTCLSHVRGFDSPTLRHRCSRYFMTKFRRFVNEGYFQSIHWFPFPALPITSSEAPL